MSRTTLKTHAVKPWHIAHKSKTWVRMMHREEILLYQGEGRWHNSLYAVRGMAKPQCGNRDIYFHATVDISSICERLPELTWTRLVSDICRVHIGTPPSGRQAPRTHGKTMGSCEAPMNPLVEIQHDPSEQFLIGLSEILWIAGRIIETGCRTICRRLANTHSTNWLWSLVCRTFGSV